MLNPFPELLFLAPLSATLLRAAAAAVFLLAGVAHARGTEAVPRRYVLAVVEILIGLSLAFGFYTQVGALIGILVSLAWLIVSTLRPTPMSTALLTLVLCLSLLLSGAGPLSFDLPL